MQTSMLKIVEDGDIVYKKDYINYQRAMEPKHGVLFVDYVLKKIKSRGRRHSSSFEKNYKTVIKHILIFSELNNCQIFTNSVNSEFLDDFICYLEDRNCKHNYILSLITNVKSLVKLAANDGYAVDSTYNDIILAPEEGFSIYLSMIDIARIYYFIGLTKKQEKIRDLFIVGCLTALRYSDYSTLTRNNLVDKFIIKTTQKTGVTVKIPIHLFVDEIFKKYEDGITLDLSIQHFNRYVKLICRKIGFNNIISYSYTRGGKKITEVKQKWELISSHTARRSAATNMYISGMSPMQIMAITGHTTEKAFLRYIRIAKDDFIKQIAAHSFFN